MCTNYNELSLKYNKINKLIKKLKIKKNINAISMFWNKFCTVFVVKHDKFWCSKVFSNLKCKKKTTQVQKL